MRCSIRFNPLRGNLAVLPWERSVLNELLVNSLFQSSTRQFSGSAIWQGGFKFIPLGECRFNPLRGNLAVLRSKAPTAA